METIGVGIIGCSPIAEIHAKALEEISGVTLKGCVDIDSEILKNFSAKFGVKSYVNHSELLKREDISVVILCLPHFMHLPLALDAINAGKHLIIEKPIALNVQEGGAIIEVCNEKKLYLNVIYQNRFVIASKELKRLISENALGRILYAHLSLKWYREPSYYQKKPWRGTWKGAGGGVLMIQAIHMFDLLQWFLGDVDKVYGRTRTLFHRIEVEDWASGWISFKSGTIADFHATTLHYPEEPACIEIIGEKGSAILQEKRGYLSLKVNLLNGQSFNVQPSQSFGDIDNQDGCTPALLSTEGHKAELESYFERLQKRKGPDVNGKEALKSLAIIEAIYISSQMVKATRVRK